MEENILETVHDNMVLASILPSNFIILKTFFVIFIVMQVSFDTPQASTLASPEKASTSDSHKKEEYLRSK